MRGAPVARHDPPPSSLRNTSRRLPAGAGAPALPWTDPPSATARPCSTSCCPASTRRRRCPGCSARIPAGARAIVVDNGSTRRLAATSRATRGADSWSHCPQRGYGAACHAGLVAATRRVRRVLRLRRLARPAGRAADCSTPSAAAPTSSSAGGVPTTRGAWPLHARARQPRAGAPGPPRAPACRCATSGRCGSRAASRCSRSASPTAAAATRSRWCVRAARAGWTIVQLRRRLRPARRAVEGHRHRPRHRAGGARHERRAGSRDDAAEQLGSVTMRASPSDRVPGRVKTRSSRR